MTFWILQYQFLHKKNQDLKLNQLKLKVNDTHMKN